MMIFLFWFITYGGRWIGIDQMIDQYLQPRPNKRNGEQRSEHDEFRGQHVLSVACSWSLASEARRMRDGHGNA